MKDGRGYPEGINTLGQEGEEAEEEQAGCDHQEGQHCPVLRVQDNLWGQGQSRQSPMKAVVTLFHSSAFSKFLLQPSSLPMKINFYAHTHTHTDLLSLFSQFLRKMGGELEKPGSFTV